MLPVAFLALILGGLGWRSFAQPGSASALGLAGLALLVAGGIWMILRLRFPGSPRLRVDAAGMRYVRGGRERGLAWKQVGAIEILHPRREMRFVPADGDAPIVMHRDMISADGRRFDMLIEDYWRGPK